jgi:hypothetical protein
MGTAIRTSVSLMILYLICGSCVNKECKEEYKNLNLPPSYLNWFENSGSGTYKPVKSAKGLSESLYIEKHMGTSSSVNQPSDPCIIYNKQQNALYYNSDLYNFQFSFQIIQEQDNPYLLCQIYDNNSHPGWVKMCYNLATEKSYPITVQTRNSFDSVTSITGLNILDSLVLPKKSYYNVYQITNGFFKDKANNFSITEFYLDKNEGLIQFSQKNGDVWNF